MPFWGLVLVRLILIEASLAIVILRIDHLPSAREIAFGAVLQVVSLAGLWWLSRLDRRFASKHSFDLIRWFRYGFSGAFWGSTGIILLIFCVGSILNTSRSGLDSLLKVPMGTLILLAMNCGYHGIVNRGARLRQVMAVSTLRDRVNGVAKP